MPQESVAYGNNSELVDTSLNRMHYIQTFYASFKQRCEGLLETQIAVCDSLNDADSHDIILVDTFII
jgi:NADH:ubiquinone oxidoreductase subunit E